jgi:hypothetical protein
MMEGEGKKRILVLWTSGEKDTALNMVFMYSLNGKLKGWWDEVTLLVWGASTKLLGTDAEIQEKLKALQEAGVETIACRACANNLGLVEKLESLNVQVFFTGEYLSRRIQAGDFVLSV